MNRKFSQEYNELANRYGLTYQFKYLENYINNCWDVVIHSLYNENGCFTIYIEPARDDIVFYVSDKYYEGIKKRCQKLINVYEIEKDAWRKYDRIWIFKNPFFYWSTNKIFKALLEVIEESIKKNDTLFGIAIK